MIRSYVPFMYTLSMRTIDEIENQVLYLPVTEKCYYYVIAVFIGNKIFWII